ncbi:MAG: nucleoside-diphosphate kinase, partial [Lentisphaerota bacterium]
MEKSQARAHMKLWQRIIQKKNKGKELFAKPRLSPEKALRFLSRKVENDNGFVWRHESSGSVELAPPGVLAFVESSRKLRTRAADGYHAVAYHAARGDIFNRIFQYLAGFETEVPDLFQEMTRLKEQAEATEDVLSKVRINLEALRLLDKFIVSLSGSVLQGYAASGSEDYETLLKNDLFRQNLYFYLEKNGKPFGSFNKSLVGFAIQEGDEKYIVALNLGEPKYPGVDGGMPKAWGQLYGQKVFQELTGETDPESPVAYQVVNRVTGEVYGMGEERKPYPFWMLTQGALPIGVPSPDIQILKLKAIGEIAPQEKKEQLGSLLLQDLRALVAGNAWEQMRQQKPRSYWLKKSVESIQKNHPEELKQRLQAVFGIGEGRDKAKIKATVLKDFGGDGVRPVMAFVAALVPELLEDMQDWDPEVYQTLKGIMQDPELKDLFEKGQVSFSDSSRDTAVVITRTLKEVKDGFEQTRHVVIPIHFAKTPYNKDEGKVWFGVGSIAVLGLVPGLIYQTRDRLLNLDYERKHTLASLNKEGWRLGVPVVKRKDPAGISQPGWRFQVLQLVPVGVSPAETEAQKNRSEMRGPIEQFGEKIEKGLATFVMFKPDAMALNPKTGKYIFQEMLEVLMEKGFEIAAFGAPTWLAEEEARKFYAVHQGKWFYEPLVRYVLAGPVIPVLVRYSSGNAVEEIRKVLPELRNQFGVEKGDKEKGIVDQNKIHASDSIPNVFVEGGVAFRSEVREGKDETTSTSDEIAKAEMGAQQLVGALRAAGHPVTF